MQNMIDNRRRRYDMYLHHQHCDINDFEQGDYKNIKQFNPFQTKI
jgi:hypothetical protein